MARLFSGDNSGDYLTSSDIYDNLSFLLVSAWINPADLTESGTANYDYMGIVIKGIEVYGSYATTSWYIVLDRRDSENTLALTISDGVDSTSAATITTIKSKISVGTWYNVVAAWDGTNQDIWLSTGDTAAAGVVEASMNADDGYPLAIGGGRAGAPQRSFDGSIAEVAIYTSGSYPTAGEVAGFHSARPLSVRMNGLASYWPIIGRSSPEVDLISKQDMTIAGTPTVSPHPPIMYPALPMVAHAPSAFIPVTGPFPTFFRV